MAVNVSPHQLTGPRLAEDVATMLELHGLPPERVVLEVSEPGLEPDPARIEEH